MFVFFFKQKTAYEMRISDWSSDVCSSDLDSSLICALAAPMAPRGLNTFSVTFDSAEHDESAFQTEMARSLGTRHRSVNCGSHDIAGSFPEVVRFTERPILRTAPAPLFRLSGLVRQADMKVRSEEHTSELQSLMRTSYAVFCLKKIKTVIIQKEPN